MPATNRVLVATGLASLLAVANGCFDGNCSAKCLGGILVELHGTLGIGDLVTPVRVCLNEHCAVALANQYGIAPAFDEDVVLHAGWLGGGATITEWTFEISPRDATNASYHDGDVLTLAVYEPTATAPRSAGELGEPARTLSWTLTYEEREKCGNECVGVDLEGDLQGHSSAR